jgi:hypothetical protein
MPRTAFGGKPVLIIGDCELVIEGKHLSSIIRRIRRDYDE